MKTALTNRNFVTTKQQKQAIQAMLEFLSSEGISVSLNEVEVHWSSISNGWEFNPELHDEVIEVIANTNSGYFWIMVNRNNEVVESGLEDCYE